MRKVVKAVVFTTAAGISIATKFSNQSAIAEETKAQMLDICATDNTCIEVVDTYFERCFNTYYSMGSRYSSGRLDAQGLAGCVNDYAKAEYFVVE
ncbi:MAG: hypothetical protein AAFO95_02365 [Cyanobacteria bacterium J06600_6]